jgi:hypothetical protein
MVYALVLNDRGWVFADRRGETFARRELELRLDRTEQVIRLHRLRTVRVELQVQDRGTAATGLALIARLADCPCGACDGPLSETDARGRITLGEFRPEEWESVELRDGQGRVRWKGDPRDWLPGGRFEIRLEAGGTSEAADTAATS